MPIRFRCVYCDKLLGIAHRKANTVVNCPQCGQALIVPSPPEGQGAEEEQPTPPPAQRPSRTTPVTSPPKDRLFESNEFDDLVEEQDNTLRGTVSAEPSAPSYPQPIRHSVAPMPTVAPPPPAPPAGLVLSGGKLILLILVVLGLIAAAFGGGFFVGKSMNG